MTPTHRLLSLMASFAAAWSPLILAQSAPPTPVAASSPPSQYNAKPILIAGSCDRPVFHPSSSGSAPNESVRVRLQIDSKGNVESSYVAMSSGAAEFDEVVASALSACKFHPGYQGGRPASSSLLLEGKLSSERVSLVAR